jgi:hypothetical protein
VRDESENFVSTSHVLLHLPPAFSTNKRRLGELEGNVPESQAHKIKSDGHIVGSQDILGASFARTQMVPLWSRSRRGVEVHPPL